MFKKLLKIYQFRSALEKDIMVEKQKFEDSIALKKAQLADLIEQESLLREEAFLELEEKKLDSIKEDNYTIFKQIKKTKQIIDNTKLYNSIIYNSKEISLIINPDIDIVSLANEELFEEKLLIKNKIMVNEIIDKFEKVEGKLLDGVEIKKTKFITIKNN